MPLGSIPSNRRLGIANSQTKKASGFGTNVLKLPTNFPIYQQQLVHNTEFRDGPFAGAEWCGNVDSTQVSNVYTFREISAHDTQFARRNLTVDVERTDFRDHRATHTDQLYYVNNEPEVGSTLSNNPNCGSHCWEPRDRLIDSHVSGVFTNPNSQFWQSSAGFYVNCPESPIDYKRIRSEALNPALSYVYLRLRRETAELERGHFVLPPSAADARLGWIDPDHPNPDSSAYWQHFYNSVHLSGVTIGSSHEDQIPTSDLPALHFHHYSNSPLDYPTMTPLQSVAMSATFIRRGVEWYRTSYPGANPLPSNILLSEMGPDWRDTPDPRQMAGSWTGFQKGLEWWNTWLCWLTRNAPNDCNLQGWDTGAHTLHACIHHPSMVPYSDLPENFVQNSRNQWYFNSDEWCTDVFYNMDVVEIPELQREVKFRAYERSFSIHEIISWEGLNWYRTPFGACYAVWARVGADPVTTNLNTGWVLTTTQGTELNVNVTLPAGWSTVYFPVIKNIGTFIQSTQFAMQWVHPDGRILSHGVISMDEFSDSGEYPYNGINQKVYAAMIIPAVCYASVSRTVTIRFTRNLTGVGAYLGRPIVLPRICSWFITQ